jgi:hypothetical protein
MAKTTETAAKSLRVSLSSIIALFIGLGYKTADKWDRVKLVKKVEKLPELAKEADKSDLTDEQVDLLDSLINAAEQGTSLEIVEDEDEEPTEAGEDEETEDGDGDEKPAAPAKGKGKDKKADKPAAPAKKDPPVKTGPNRPAVASQTIMKIKKATPVEQLIADADDAYVAKSGGKSNPKESAWAIKLALQVLTAADIVEVTDGKVSKKA